MSNVSDQYVKNLQRSAEKGWLCVYCMKSLKYCENKEARDIAKSGQLQGGPDSCQYYLPSPSWDYVNEMKYYMEQSDEENELPK